MEKELKPEDDVIILGDKNNVFYTTNGTIKEVLPNGNALVHFHKEFSYLFGWEYTQGKTTHEFAQADLQKFILDEQPEIKASRLFHRNYHSLYTLPYKFSPQNPCMHNSCKENAVKRILFNCWGTVAEYDVCKEHDMDGYWGDGFNRTPNYQATVKEV